MPTCSDLWTGQKAYCHTTGLSEGVCMTGVTFPAETAAHPGPFSFLAGNRERVKARKPTGREGRDWRRRGARLLCPVSFALSLFRDSLQNAGTLNGPGRSPGDERGRSMLRSCFYTMTVLKREGRRRPD